MTKETVRNLYEAMRKITHEICDNYVDCNDCPFSANWHSVVFMKDGSPYETGCAQNVLHRVFEYNMSKEV